MEKHGETGEHSICRRLSTLHRLTRQQRSSLTFHGIIYESTPCSWNSEKISLVSLNFTRCAREIRQKLREIFFRIPLTWSWLVVIILWVAPVRQLTQLISVGFIPESHWDYPTVSAVKVISLAHSKLVMLHDWLNLRKRNLIGSDTNWRQGYCIAITLQLLFCDVKFGKTGTWKDLDS